MGISVCMIVKNESPVIARCLDSIQELSDEIIVVDTGSSDDTKEICSTYDKCKVFDMLWEDDFSKAWNYALGLCSHPWTMVMAADHVLGSEPTAIKEFLSKIGNTVVDFKVVHGQLSYYFPRVWRTGMGYHFVGAVHEYLKAPKGVKTDFLILHRRNAKPDPERNLKILTKIKDKTPRDLFYLGRENYDLGRYKEAIKWLVEYIPVSTWSAERAEAFYTIGVCYNRLGDKKRAKWAALEAMYINPMFRSPIVLLKELTGDPAWDKLITAADNSNTVFAWH